MAWPTDDLTKANLDAGTDQPSLARPELEAAIDKLKLILAEISAGETIWHSGNDGSGSGLDADTLDGQEGSFYRDAFNLNTGIIPLLRLPNGAGQGIDSDKLDGQHGSHYLNSSNQNAGILPLARLSGITANELAENSVAASEIANSSVQQSHLNTGINEVSYNGPAQGNESVATLAGGQYGFYPQTKGSGSGQISARIVLSNGVGIGTTYGTFISLYAENSTIYAQQRYINSSPPHRIKTLDYLDFIYLLVDSNGNIKSTWIANDPPWYHNGPTSTVPDAIDKKGIKYQNKIVIPQEILDIQYADPAAYSTEVAGLTPTLHAITDDIKNADMDLIPSPFLSSESTDKIILLCPDQSGAYVDLYNTFKTGASVSELFTGDYLVIGNEVRDNRKPKNVALHKIKWKKTAQ